MYKLQCLPVSDVFDEVAVIHGCNTVRVRDARGARVSPELRESLPEATQLQLCVSETRPEKKSYEVTLR